MCTSPKQLDQEGRLQTSWTMTCGNRWQVFESSAVSCVIGLEGTWSFCQAREHEAVGPLDLKFIIVEEKDQRLYTDVSYMETCLTNKGCQCNIEFWSSPPEGCRQNRHRGPLQFSPKLSLEHLELTIYPGSPCYGLPRLGVVLQLVFI
jgi:hypothetical protein